MNLFLEECNASGQRRYLSNWQKFLKQSDQQQGDKQIFGNMKIEGSNDVRSFCLATISVAYLGTALSLRIWRGKGLMGPDEVSTKF